ncbi:glycosyltransferase family 4 protein [Achromobacter xylosoxidans]
MHILHLAGSHLGGMEFRVLEQAQWLKEQGHVVAIAAPPGSETLKAAHERSLEAVGIDFESAYSPSTVLGLRRLVKRLRIEVIDAHSRADGKTSALCQDLCAVVRTRHFAKYLRTSLRKRLEWRVGCHHVIATSGEGRNDIVSAGFAPVSASAWSANGPTSVSSWTWTRPRCASACAPNSGWTPTPSWSPPSACCARKSARTTCSAWSSNCASARSPPSRWWSARPPPRRPPSAPAARAGR